MTKAQKPPETDEPDPFEQITQTIAEAVGADRNAMLYLERYSDRSGNFALLRKYTPGDFDVDAVRQEYGGGMFRVRPRASSGQWLPGSQRFEVEGPSKAAQHDEPAPTAPQLGTDPAVMFLREQMADIRAELRGLRSGSAPAADPVAMAAEFAKAGATQFAGMVDLLERMKPAPAEPPDMIERMMDMFERGMKLGRESDGGGYGATFGPLAAALAERIGSAPTPAAGAGRSMIAPRADGAAPPPTPATVVPHPLIHALQLLIAAAEAGSQKPEVYAELAEEQVPELPELLDDAVERAGSVANLLAWAAANVDQRVRSHHAFLTAAIEYLTGDDQEGESEEEGDELAGVEDRGE